VNSFTLDTARREQMIDITPQVRDAVAASGVSDGMVLVYCPHTTAAITINENADPAVVTDLLGGLCHIAPADAPYRHLEGNSDGHIKASLVGASELIPLAGGRLALGTWQGIWFCEYDGPRSRRVLVQVVG
jgi:secondary thiamine-phosphate synthase enzyme